MNTKLAAWILQVSRGRLTVVSPSERRSVDPSPGSNKVLANEIFQAFTELGYRGEPVLVAVSAFDCLVAAFHCENPKMLRNRKLLRFSLEERLPLAAEEFIADFIVTKGRVLGIALPTSTVSSIIQEIGEHGVHVATVTPASLVLLSGIVEASKALKTHAFGKDGIIAWQNGEWLEIFWLKEGRLFDWAVVEAERESVARELDLKRSTEGRLPMHVVRWEEEPAESDLWPDDAIDLTPGCSREKCLGQEAAKILQFQRKPLVDFQGPELGSLDRYRAIRGRLRLAYATTLLLFLSLGLFAHVRDNHYRKLSAALAERERVAFSTIFPERRVPVGIRAHLESEFNKRKGLRGERELPESASAFDLLHGALTGLKPELRYRIVSLSLSGGELHLQAEARSHGEAEQIAAWLEGQGFVMEPITSENLAAEGVLFTARGVHFPTQLAERGAP